MMKSKRTLCGLVAIVICIQAGAYRSVASTGSATGQVDTMKALVASGQTDTLKAAVFTGRSVKHFSDHQKFYLNKEDRNSHATALETLKLIPGILVKDDEATLLNGKGLTILLNGLPPALPYPCSPRRTSKASTSTRTPRQDIHSPAAARWSTSSPEDPESAAA